METFPEKNVAPGPSSSLLKITWPKSCPPNPDAEKALEIVKKLDAAPVTTEEMVAQSVASTSCTDPA